MGDIERVHRKLVTYYSKLEPPVVNGIAIGYVTDLKSPQILILIDPAAAECERKAIEQQVGRIARGQCCHFLQASRFVGLQGAIAGGASVSAGDKGQYNYLPTSTGSLG